MRIIYCLRYVWLCLGMVVLVVSCTPAGYEPSANDEPAGYEITLPIRNERPNFLPQLSPAENQIVSLANFHGKEGDYRGTSIDWRETENFNSSICLEFEIGVLAQDGDDFTDESVVTERITLTINDIEQEIISVVILLSSLDIVDIDGNVLRRNVAPRIVCSRVDLDAGQYEVEFKFRQTSGDVHSYRWQFILEE